MCEQSEVTALNSEQSEVKAFLEQCDLHKGIFFSSATLATHKLHRDPIVHKICKFIVEIGQKKNKRKNICVNDMTF